MFKQSVYKEVDFFVNLCNPLILWRVGFGYILLLTDKRVRNGFRGTPRTNAVHFRLVSGSSGWVVCSAYG